MPRVTLPVVPRWLRWTVVVTVAAAIFYLSVITAPPENPVISSAPLDLLPLDKWRHLLAYAAFAGSLAYATVDWEWSAVRLAVLVVAVATAYGMGVEAMQATLPDRYFSIGDAYANVLGAALVAPWFAVRSRVPVVHVPRGDSGSRPADTGDGPDE